MKIKLYKTKFGNTPPPPDHLYASVLGVSADDYATIQRLKLGCEYGGETFHFPITVRTPSDGRTNETVICVSRIEDWSNALQMGESESERRVFLLYEDLFPTRGECPLDAIFGGRGSVKKDVRIAYCIARITEYVRATYPDGKISVCCGAGLIEKELYSALVREIEDCNSKPTGIAAFAAE